MILCCGEALIDMIPTSTLVGREGFVPYSGGAAFNTAIALGRLGVRTGMITGLSTDLFGQQLRADLCASHVDISYISLTDQPSTLSFVQLSDGHASYSFFDENSAGRMLHKEKIPTLPSEISALYFGGISLACEPCGEAYEKLAVEQYTNRVVMLDPNIRPNFIKEAEHYRTRLDKMIRYSDIVKVSDEDLNWIYPGPDSLKEKIKKIYSAGTSVVILTRGSDGVTAFLKDGSEISVSSQEVSIVDTVGAGDTFNAGLLANLSEQGLLTKAGLSSISVEAMKAALTVGASVAAVTVSRSGANPPWREELSI